MDEDLKLLLMTAWHWRCTDSCDWKDIYRQLYGADDEGLGDEVEQIDEPTEAGLYQKINGKRKEQRGGYQRGYYFFLDSGFTGESAFRVVVRTVDLRTAFRIMELVVPDVVDDTTSFAGVHSAKVASGAAYAAGKKDLMVIYCDDSSTQRAVVAKIEQYKRMGRFGDGDFRDPLPVGIAKRARGLGTASQPPGVPVMNGTGGVSYGKYLSQVVEIAMATAEHHGVESRKDFLDVASKVLHMAGIESKYPDRINPPTPAFAHLLPLRDQTAEAVSEAAGKIKLG